MNGRQQAVAAATILLCLGPQCVEAAGFAVHGQSTSQMGNAFAGVAASALDASTVWWNPAGMTEVKGSQVVNAVNFMRTSTKFSNDNSSPALGQPLGTEGGDAGVFRVTPFLYGKHALTKDWHVGIGINTPFGLRTVWEGDWMGRFQAQKSESQAININPSFAFKVDDKLSIGGGVSFQRFEAKLTNAVNYTAAAVNAGLAAGAITAAQVPGLLNPAAPGNLAGLEGSAEVSGDDWGYGWNVGFLLKPWDRLRVGANYRSRIRYTIEGDAEFSGPRTTNPLAATLIGALSQPGAPLASGPVSANITLPDSLSVSAVVGNDRDAWNFLFDVTWFGWSSLSQVAFVRDNGNVLSRLNFDWRDTWRLAFGVTRRINENLQLRAGYAWDQTAVDDERTRSPRLPDSTRHWFSLGSRHVIKRDASSNQERLSIDLAANFVKANEAHIPMRSDPSAAASGVLDGRFRTNSATLSAQMNYTFR